MKLPSNRTTQWVIACGGTGGHLTPGIALAQALKRKGCCVVLAVSQKSIDARLLLAYPDLAFVAVPGCGFAGNGLRRLKALWEELKGLVFAFRLLRENPQAQVVGFGGFATLPWVIGARCLSRRIVLHEANRVVGRTIRLLGRFADRICVPKGVTVKNIKPGVLVEMGLPVRDEMRSIAKLEARALLDMPAEGRLLVVFGGSQGASALTHFVKEHAIDLVYARVHTLCLTGLNHEAQTTRYPVEEGGYIEITYKPFCDQMALLLSAADIAISRSGAGSIAEIIRMRLPTIFVPYPHAADDHQRANAAYVASTGACKIVDPMQMQQILWPQLKVLLDDPAVLPTMARAWENFDTEDSQARLAELVFNLSLDIKS